MARLNNPNTSSILNGLLMLDILLIIIGNQVHFVVPPPTQREKEREREKESKREREREREREMREREREER